VLDGLIEHARAGGGGIVWCSARLGAVAFYRRATFVAHGQPFSVEGVDHIAMWREL
jgi:predicted GNAT family N-acyltransferase